MNSLIVGLQYGDEGKGRVSAHFVKDYDWNVRFNGGPNAGHTVYHNGEKYALHHLPAGAVMGKKIALDAGMVINTLELLEECTTANTSLDNLYVSERAHIIQSEHRTKDINGSGVGSTKKGIAYAYADKALRKGKLIKQDDIIWDVNTYDGLPPVATNESALYEGGQGIMLDVNYGHYPYVTSSSVFPSTIHNITHKIGVMKGYTTRVGEGPPDLPLVDELAELGNEYGVTTGRKRRCYWLIADEVDYAMSILQPDEVVVTKLDILKDMDIKVYEESKLHTVGSLDVFKEFLLERWPQIKYFSESPDGDLLEVR